MSGLDLAQFTEDIQELRDTAFAAMIKAHETHDDDGRRQRGVEWFAYAHTLSILHHSTGGEYGTPLGEQSSPYAVINASAREVDRKAGQR